MRILLLNDTLYRKSLEARGHEVRACGPVATYLMPDQDQFEFTFPSNTMLELDEILARLGDFKPDLILHSETHTTYFYHGIEQASCPTVWRTIDNHLHLWQPRYAVTHDLVMVAQKDYLASFELHHPNTIWLPLHSFPDVHHDRRLLRDIPVAFVGSLDPAVHPDRARFFEGLRRYLPVEVGTGMNQTQISELYNRAQIVVNQCVHRDLNYRVFEAMANGAMLVTPSIQNGQPELFQEGIDLVTYLLHDVEAAAERIRYYLDHEAERMQIARAGQARVLANHTLEHRVQTLLEQVERHGEAARRMRASRLNVQAYRSLAPLYAAMHSQGFMPATLAIEALQALHHKMPADALGIAARLGLEQLNRGSAARATPYLEFAVDRGAERVSGLLGRARMMQGRIAEALVLLDRALRNQEDATLHFWRALCLDGLDRRDEARLALKECLKLEATHSEAQRLLQRWDARG